MVRHFEAHEYELLNRAEFAMKRYSQQLSRIREDSVTLAEDSPTNPEFPWNWLSKKAEFNQSMQELATEQQEELLNLARFIAQQKELKSKAVSRQLTLPDYQILNQARAVLEKHLKRLNIVRRLNQSDWD